MNFLNKSGGRCHCDLRVVQGVVIRDSAIVESRKREIRCESSALIPLGEEEGPVAVDKLIGGSIF